MARVGQAWPGALSSGRNLARTHFVSTGQGAAQAAPRQRLQACVEAGRLAGKRRVFCRAGADCSLHANERHNCERRSAAVKRVKKGSNLAASPDTTASNCGLARSVFCFPFSSFPLLFCPGWTLWPSDFVFSRFLTSLFPASVLPPFRHLAFSLSRVYPLRPWMLDVDGLGLVPLFFSDDITTLPPSCDDVDIDTTTT